MKTIRIITSLILVVFLLFVPVLAAEFTPSAERKDAPQPIGNTTNEEGQAIVGVIHHDEEQKEDIPAVNLIVVPLSQLETFTVDESQFGENKQAATTIENSITENLRVATVELKENLIHNIVPNFQQVWEEITGGAPVENVIVSDVFDVSLVDFDNGQLVTNKKISFSIIVPGITADDKFVVLHKPTGTETWELVEHTIGENNVITITTNGLSPFAIVRDSAKMPSSDVQSPQTGVTETGVAAAAVAAVIFAAGAVVIGKKTKKA